MSAYIAGILELNSDLTYLPDNEKARQLLVDFKQHEPEQRERMRMERLNRGKTAFDSALQKHNDSSLFQTYELKTSKPVKEVHAALFNAFNSQTALRIKTDNSPAPETFETEAVQEFSTFLATSGGRRICVLVCTQTKEDEPKFSTKSWNTRPRR